MFSRSEVSRHPRVDAWVDAIDGNFSGLSYPLVALFAILTTILRSSEQKIKITWGRSDRFSKKFAKLLVSFLRSRMKSPFNRKSKLNFLGTTKT